MYKNVVPLSKTNHADKKLRKIDNFKFAAGSYIASLMLPEVYRAGLTYPVVFLEDGNGFGIYALLGLVPDENLFVDESGKWNASYIPGVVKRYPFVLGQSENKDTVMVCIDEASEFISDTEGMPFFDESGKPSAIIEDARKFLTDLHSMNMMTRKFCEEMNTLGLLESLDIRFNGPDGKERNITGCHRISETKLKDLPDDTILDLRKRGALPAMYAQLMSMPRVERIANMYGKKHGTV